MNLTVLFNVEQKKLDIRTHMFSFDYNRLKQQQTKNKKTLQKKNSQGETGLIS